MQRMQQRRTRKARVETAQFAACNGAGERGDSAATQCHKHELAKNRELKPKGHWCEELLIEEARWSELIRKRII
jgi:hypothetical protein